MANKRDYYEVLGISKSASQDDIKHAFRRMAMKYHPDRNKAPDAEEKFKEINEAYEVLSDPNKRQTYDQFGFDGLNNQGFTGAGNPFDVFNQFFGGGRGGQNVHFSFGGDDEGNPFEDIFGSVFGGGRSQRTRRNTEEKLYDLDINARFGITFIESILGCTKKIKYKIKKTCPECNGSGASKEPGSIHVCENCGGSGVVTRQQRTPFGVVQSQGICPKCHGAGKIIHKVCSTCGGAKFLEAETEIEINIPAGIKNGETLAFYDKGNIIKSKTGNLNITFFVQSSDIFKREGNNIIVNVLVDPLKAITGGTISVPTPYGSKNIELRPSTANGETITLSGYGIKNVKKGLFNHNSDLIVKIIYAKPNRYSSSDLNKIKDLSDQTNPEVEKYYKDAQKEFNHE